MIYLVVSAIGLPLSNDYIISLKASARVGADKSIGYLNFIGNLGQMFGPIVLGYLFAIGYSQGALYLLAASAVSLVVFLLLSRNQKISLAPPQTSPLPQQ